MVATELILFPLLFAVVLAAVWFIGQTYLKAQEARSLRKRDLAELKDQLRSMDDRLSRIQDILEDVP